MKKGIIFTAIILVVAAVLTVVFVTLFKERTTDAVANQVISVVDEGYLSDGEDKETIKNYLNSMRGVTSGEHNTEVNLSLKLYSAYESLGDFYRKHMIFTSYSDAYRENRDAVIDNLNSASSKVNEIVSYIRDTESLVSGSPYWEARTWDDVRVMMFDFIDDNNSAFIALNNIYPASGNSKLTNNAFTTEVLKAINAHFASYNEAETVSGRLTLAGYILSMAGNYLDDASVYDYIYNSIWQNIIADITEKGEESEYYSAFIVGSL